MSILGKCAACLQHHLGATVVLGGSVIGLGAVGVTVGPSIVFSSPASPAPPTSDPVEITGLARDKAAVVNGLKKLFAASRAVIDIRQNQQGFQEVVLWMDDQRDPGVINEDETLLITFAPLLRTAIAMTVPTGAEPSPAMELAALFSDTLSTEWRRRPDVRQSIVATDLTALRIERINRSEGETSLRVNLTFSSNSADEDVERRASTMFVVTLPAIARSR